MIRDIVIERFYTENFDTLRKKMSRAAGGVENAEDVVQEAIYRALKYWDSFRGTTYEEFQPWFMSVLSRTLKDHLKVERMYGCTDKEPEEELVGDQELKLIGKQSYKRVAEVISLKKSPMKDVLTLYFLRGKRPKEISQILDMPNKTIRMCVLRFKEKIDDLLKDGSL